jgi:hypothetical protein
MEVGQMASNMLQPNTWFSVFDRGTVINDYGEMIIGSAFMGSGLCRVVSLKTKHRRTDDGIIREESATIHYGAGFMKLDPDRNFVTIGGTGYNVLDGRDGSNITQTMFAKVNRIVN